SESLFVIAARSDYHDTFETSTERDRPGGERSPQHPRSPASFCESRCSSRRPVPLCTRRGLALPTADLAAFAVDRGDSSPPRQSGCRTDTAVVVGGRTRARRGSAATLGGASYRRHFPNAQRSAGAAGFDRTLFTHSQSPLSRQRRRMGRLCDERTASLAGAA